MRVFICPSVCRLICVYLRVRLYHYVCMPVWPAGRLPVRDSIWLSACLPAYLSLSPHASVYCLCLSPPLSMFAAIDLSLPLEHYMARGSRGTHTRALARARQGFTTLPRRINLKAISHPLPRPPAPPSSLLHPHGRCPSHFRTSLCRRRIFPSHKNIYSSLHMRTGSLVDATSFSCG